MKNTSVFINNPRIKLSNASQKSNSDHALRLPKTLLFCGFGLNFLYLLDQSQSVGVVGINQTTQEKFIFFSIFLMLWV